MKRKDSGLQSRFECKGEDGLWREVEVISVTESGNVTVRHIGVDRATNSSEKFESTQDGNNGSEQTQHRLKSQTKLSISDITVECGRVRARSERWSTGSGALPLVGSSALCEFSAWTGAGTSAVKQEQASTRELGDNPELMECTVLAVDAPRVQLQKRINMVPSTSAGDITPSGVFFAEAPSPPRPSSAAFPTAITRGAAPPTDSIETVPNTMDTDPKNGESPSPGAQTGVSGDSPHDPERWLLLDALWRPSSERCRIEVCISLALPLDRPSPTPPPPLLRCAFLAPA